MRRVLAVVAAAAMVAGSVALRARLDRNEVASSQVLRLTCAAELAPACEALADDDDRIELTLQAAGTTADRLVTAEGDLGLDGWLTTAPWPVIVDQQRQARSLEPLFGPPGPTIARSPLVIAVWKDRAAALGPRCGGPVGWKCLGEAAGTTGGWAAIGGRPEWGPVKVRHAPPSTDAVGLVVLGQAVASWFGRTDVSTIDLDDEAFQTWFAGLERSASATGSSLETMLAVGRSDFDAAGTTEAEAAPLLARAARGKDVDLLYPSPMATADVVSAVPVGDTKVPAALRGVAEGSTGRRALAAAGWRVEGEGRAQGVPDTPPLPDTSGLPSPGLLDALRARWHEVTGR
ncbi:MAG: substrate-binding domain-containing protein [Acidimicrobiales bacterium]